MKLQGNTILITGGGTGIGLSLAEAFAKQGNKVLISGRRMEKLQEAKAKVADLELFQGDVGTAEGVKALADKVISAHPEINVLINNAGVAEYRNIKRSEEDLEKLTYELDINVKGPIRMNSAFMDTLKKNKGTIINVSSGLAFVPLIAMPIYCATKAALHSYSITLRQQLEGLVEVIELAPPAVKTEMTDEFADGEGFAFLTTDELTKATLDGIRSGKELITPGQSSQLRFMSRLAPGFIEKQLKKGGTPYIPA
ncbi:MAG: SDR family NAD(P)-dependent oxidoreductase [Spirochaetota bacterium]